MKLLFENWRRYLNENAPETQLVPVPDSLIEAYKALGQAMMEIDPETEIRHGGWDVGNFVQPGIDLRTYNRLMGGIPVSHPGGRLSVELLKTLFDENADPMDTGWTLVQKMQDREIHELWQKTKQEVDNFAASVTGNDIQ